MAKITETRLTLAALIYGIEIDLKNLIKQKITPFHGDLGFFNNEELKSRVIDRFERDNPDSLYLEDLDAVVEFLDFQDTFVILNKNYTFLSSEAAIYLKAITTKLADITPIRNRVMHTRPLLGGDFSFTYDFISKLKKSDPIQWSTTIETRDKIEKDPNFVLTLKFPSVENLQSTVSHNLPVPDFDETGFIGRKKDVEAITKLVLTNRVVSIIGDGGIGKTALAVKVAYDIVDMNEVCPFELIIWTSAKTTMLTHKGIEEIHSAISDYSGLISIISNTLEVGETSSKLEEILEYLSVFKTLLIIDNLETIHTQEVRDFIREAQTKCHIVITSRIGLGELEYPRKLDGLSQSESAKLIREIARIRNSDTLLKLPQSTLIEISEKLYFNPLAIKWFVSTVETGIPPHEVVNNKEHLLDFCLTNVYEKLTEGAISVLNTIRASRKKISIAEIIYLSEFQPLDVRKYLIELFRTTLIAREITDGNNYDEITYFISDFAKDFLSQNYPVNPDFIKQNIKKSKSLNAGLRQINKVKSYNEFSINALTFENQNQMISAKFLQEALSFSKNRDFKKSLEKVKEAKNIDPNYFEVYRVGAFIKAQNGDLLSAEEDYKLGLEIAPDNIRLLFYYSQFLLFKLEDVENAIIHAKKVYEQKPEHPFTAFLFARCFNTAQEFNKAIQIMNALIKEVDLDSKNLRMAYTELISYYSNIGRSQFIVNNDIESGIAHFKKSFGLFEKCKRENILDFKLVKNFCVSLFLFIKHLPTTKIEANREAIKTIISDNDEFINIAFELKQKIIKKYHEKFNDNSINHLIQFESLINRNVGNISKPKTQNNFVFIECDGKSIFAHKYDFLDIESWVEWKQLRNGQLVSFKIGEGAKGKFAKDIKLMN